MILASNIAALHIQEAVRTSGTVTFDDNARLVWTDSAASSTACTSSLVILKHGSNSYSNIFNRHNTSLSTTVNHQSKDMVRCLFSQPTRFQRRSRPSYTVRDAVQRTVNLACQVSYNQKHLLQLAAHHAQLCLLAV